MKSADNIVLYLTKGKEKKNLNSLSSGCKFISNPHLSIAMPYACTPNENLWVSVLTQSPDKAVREPAGKMSDIHRSLWNNNKNAYFYLLIETESGCEF